MVVLNGDHDGVAQTGAAALLAAVTGDAMAGLLELRGLVGVDVQQRAGLRPLVALEPSDACRGDAARRRGGARTLWIVERCRPVSLVRRIEPQFVRRRASRIRCSCSALSAHGQDLGTGRRGARHSRVARSASLAARQRCHQRCAVAGATTQGRRGGPSLAPSSISRTSARRPASPSLHATGRLIAPALLGAQSSRRAPSARGRCASRWKPLTQVRRAATGRQRATAGCSRACASACPRASSSASRARGSASGASRAG